jgi:hypothetical protein
MALTKPKAERIAQNSQPVHFLAGNYFRAQLRPQWRAIFAYTCHIINTPAPKATVVNLPLFA